MLVVCLVYLLGSKEGCCGLALLSDVVYISRLVLGPSGACVFEILGLRYNGCLVGQYEEFRA